jgi:hypothetical protein
MGLIWLLKGALFVYECIRLVIVATYVIFQGGGSGFPIMVFAAPVVLFPLMALFILLDINRYKNYLPLFAAGKCVLIFALLGWSIISTQVTMIGRFPGASTIELMLLSGDFFAMAAVVLLIKSVKKAEAETVLEVE